LRFSLQYLQYWKIFCSVRNKFFFDTDELLCGTFLFYVQIMLQSAVLDLITILINIHIKVFSILIFGAFCIMLSPYHFTLPYLYWRSIDSSSALLPRLWLDLEHSA
jgi:hypothetical protein